MTHEDAIKWLGNLRNDLGNPHYECLWPYAQAIDEICELLKEQEPVKPKQPLTAGDPFWLCGNCGKEIESTMFRYCPYCGNAVKWNER